MQRHMPGWMEILQHSLVQVVTTDSRAGTFIYRGSENRGTWIRYSGGTWPFEDDKVWLSYERRWWPWANFTATDWAVVAIGVVDLSAVDFVKGLCGYER